ncbi:restriction endonuclease [Streptomyces sp. NPDC088258]|uniref:restriction endonuclease n=1 Tax=Streptomyces sp. NPDC088258 TaxID=3365849 RepID=UPI0038109176
MARRRRVAGRGRVAGRRARGKQAAQIEGIGLLVVAVVGVSLAVVVFQWLMAHWWVLVVLAVPACGAGAAWAHWRGQRARWARVKERGLRYQLSQLDALHHREFEYAVRDLMLRDGCRDAVQVGGRGDNGADVKATDPLGRRWVIQCKHRKAGWSGSAVGTPDLHVLNGTGRQLHGGDVIVLVTNGRFSSQCPPYAKSQRLHLVDRQLLGEWAAGSRPLWEILGRLPPPRGSSALS